MKRWLSALAFAVVAFAAVGAQAQEIQIRGPLAGASACRHCVNYREGRFMLSPTVGMTLQDEYSRAVVAGAQAQYHFTDGIALGLWGGYAISFDSPLTSQVQQTLNAQNAMGTFTPTANIPDAANFSRQVGRMTFLLMPQLVGIPLRGKLALFQNIFVDTDFYLMAGVVIAGVSERQSFDSDNALPGRRPTGTEPELIANQTARTGRVAFGPMFGVGLNFYVNRFFSIGFEYRAFPFAWNVAGTDEYSQYNAMAGTGNNTCGRMGNQNCNQFPDYQISDTGRFVINGSDSTFKFNQMVNLTFNFFLPTGPRIGR